MVRLRFVFAEGKYFVLAGQAQSDWVRNVKRNAAAKLRTDTQSLAVHASVDEGEKERVLGLYERKYGRKVVSGWYGASPVCIRLEPQGPPVRTAPLRGEGDATKTYASWKSERKGYYGEVAAAFDSASEEYDVTIGRNYINTWIRKRSLEVLFRLVRRDDVLLEIGAGTGEETVQVAKRVSRIVATDISPSMVELLAKKAAARKMKGKIEAVLAPASDLAKVRGLLPEGRVRVAYSFNGALNCEPRLAEFVEGISEVVDPGGYLVCSIRNRLCLMEILAYAALLRPSGMNKRKVQPMMVSVGGMDVPSRYYSVGEFLSVFREYFRPHRIIGLPALVPPAYLNDYFTRLRSLTGVFEKADRVLGGTFPFNRVGDQTLFVFQRK